MYGWSGKFWLHFGNFFHVFTLIKKLSFKKSLFPLFPKPPKSQGLQINGENRVLKLSLLDKDL
jgi:hypothetical protein